MGVYHRLKHVWAEGYHIVAFCDVMPCSLVSYKICCLEILMCPSPLCCRSNTDTINYMVTQHLYCVSVHTIIYVHVLAIACGHFLALCITLQREHTAYYTTYMYTKYTMGFQSCSMEHNMIVKCKYYVCRQNLSTLKANL